VAVALVFYLVWGRRHSALNDDAAAAAPVTEDVG